MEKIAYFSTVWSGCWLLLKYISDWDSSAEFAELRVLGVISCANGLRRFQSFIEGFCTLVGCLGALILSFDETEMVSRFL